MAPRIHDTKSAKKGERRRLAKLYAAGQPVAQPEVQVPIQLTEDDKRRAIVFADSRAYDNPGSRCVCLTVTPKHEMGDHINRNHGNWTTKKRWSCLLCPSESIDQEGMYKHLAHSHLCSICEEFSGHLVTCPRYQSPRPV